MEGFGTKVVIRERVESSSFAKIRKTRAVCASRPDMTVAAFINWPLEEVFMPMDSNSSFLWRYNAKESIYRVEVSE